MKTRLCLGISLLLCAGAAAHAQQVASLPQSENSAHGAGMQAGYLIGVKDTLAIDVYDVPNLGGTVEVDNTGSINLPLIGQIAATGRTTNQLANQIAGALDAKYMKDAIVTVSVKDAASKKITVDGSVTQPGMYEISPGTTLTQAVAMAKGPDQVADAHHVAIIRGTGPARTVSAYDLEDIRDGKAVDPSVQPDDTIVVDSSGSRKFVRDFGSVISVLGFLHP